MSNPAVQLPVPDRPASKALRVTGKVLKYTLLTFAWIVQYALYVPFIGFPLHLLRVGGKVVMILLACSIIGWPILIIWLVFFRNRPVKERRSMLKPWGIR